MQEFLASDAVAYFVSIGFMTLGVCLFVMGLVGLKSVL